MLNDPALLREEYFIHRYITQQHAAYLARNPPVPPSSPVEFAQHEFDCILLTKATALSYSLKNDRAAKVSEFTLHAQVFVHLRTITDAFNQMLHVRHFGNTPWRLEPPLPIIAVE